MANALKQRYGVESKLIASSGGAFEVVIDGELVYSKLSTGRFPNHDEIFAKIKS